MADVIPYEQIIERIKDDVDWIAKNAYARGYNTAKAEIALSGEYERAYQRGKADAQQWILCSETVTEPDHEVLCCDKYGEELIGWLSCEDDQWLCESEGEIMYDPVAWMEKPKPWKGGEAE